MKSDLILAQIVAALTTDGHLQLDSRRGVISFYSKSIESIDYFNNLFNEYFNVKGRIFRDTRGKNEKYKLFIANKKLAIFLKDKETPVGNKTKCSYVLPSWVKQGNKKVKSAYLRMVFDCEGSIFSGADRRWRLTYTMNKGESLRQNGILFLEEMRRMLNEFGIFTSNIWISKDNIRKDGSNSLQFKFEVKKISFANFSKNIGFLDKSKLERLNLALSS
ncbi:MAG: LAGLIDADG family homing endonuclease [Nanoarchaeota archaeon]